MKNPSALPAVRERQSGSDALFEMANLFPKHTGLPFVVWISTGQGVQHDIRVKVSQGPRAVPSQMVSVALRPMVHVVNGYMTPEHLALLARWIDLNRDVLIRYWEGTIDTIDAMRAIQPIQ
ncbi:MAG TPA: hypothetical protein VH601_15295 [Bryobacteraceae bacterium]|jgi:hypothetical protein